MNELSSRNATAYIPADDSEPEVLSAFSGASMLAVLAHADDAEIGIPEIYQPGFDCAKLVVVIVTTGTRPINGEDAFAVEERRLARIEEQKAAAKRLGYGGIIFLQLRSEDAQDFSSEALQSDIVSLLLAIKPSVVYTHNPFDNHPVHLGVLHHMLEAIRSLDPEERPERLYGVEVWGKLDHLLTLDRWMATWSDSDIPRIEEICLTDDELTAMAEVLALFSSQTAKNPYDVVIPHRLRERVTMADPHTVAADAAGIGFRMSLARLLREDDLTLVAYANQIGVLLGKMWSSKLG